MSDIYDRTPYTYLIGWSQQNLWYYGVQFGKGCHPSNLWRSYFTSSRKMISWTREFYGEPDIVQVRRTFKDSESARRWETKVLKKMNVVKDVKWLNESDNECCTNSGSRHSEETKRKISQSHKGRIFTEEHKRNLRNRSFKHSVTSKRKGRSRIDIFGSEVAAKITERIVAANQRKAELRRSQRP